MTRIHPDAYLWGDPTFVLDADGEQVFVGGVEAILKAKAAFDLGLAPSSIPAKRIEGMTPEVAIAFLESQDRSFVWKEES